MTVIGVRSILAILFCLIWITAVHVPLVTAREIGDYWTKRSDFILEEKKISFGGDIILNEDEISANHTLMSAKKKEIDHAFADQSKFLPRANFLQVRNKIERRKVFRIIRKLPKGALLHAHDMGTVSQEFVLKNLTYRPNLYACDSNESLKLMFFKTPDNDCEWKLLSKLRQKTRREIEINEKILKHMSMVTKNPARAYPNGDKAWDKFQSIFGFLLPFLTYKPIFEDYYYQWLEEIYDDKVIYLELRTILPDLYDLDGKVYTNSDVMQILKNVTDKFITSHPDFVGTKIIYAPMRNVDQTQLEEYLKIARQLKKDFPSFLAGFDLVGQEDKGGLLKDFAEQLEKLGEEMPLFFHAGETDWNGLSTDQNLIDAVLLNAKRIGHGYALLKHPKVLEMAREKKIAIEVNPISNQVLGLVEDLRNHPASVLFAENYPIIVSSDDPGLWGAKALSYDFYEAFIGIMSRSSDLTALKQLGINSLLYSAMNDEERSRAMLIFQRQWQEFIRDMNE